jgi:ribonuclease D
MKYSMVETNRDLLAYLRALKDQKTSIIALDTEAELNLHAYGEKLCLIQIFDGVDHVLVDPFKINKHALKALFEDRDVLKVMYDAGNDLSVMKNVYGIEIRSILDLRPAVSLLQLEKQGLHSVLASELGVFLENKNRFQKYNWTLRPISAEALEYALSDVTYLLKLKDVLLKKVCEKGLLDAFLLANLKVQNKDYTRNPSDKHSSMSGFEQFRPEQKSKAQEMSKIIEKYAARYDVPFHWIMNKNDIIKIIKDPSRLDSVQFPRRLSRASVQSILSELKNAASGAKAEH